MFQKLDLFPSSGEGGGPMVEVTLSKGPNKVAVSPHLRTETDPVSETLCFPVFRIPGNGQSLKT
jgi:hypothetical protein